MRRGGSSTMTDPFKICTVIPVYNHELAIGQTLERVLAHNIPVILVNDGSNDVCSERLESLAQQNQEQVHLVSLPVNLGKGGAVKAGLNQAHQQGYSHVLQLDADGQHDVRDIPRFIETAQQYPTKLILGAPVYDDSASQLRVYGRYLTHVWVWINTLSFQIKDSMCGFRIYPVSSLIPLLQKHACGNRMAFDTEVIIRWYWQGGGVINLETRVLYPEDGVSHFHYLRDNLLLSSMHARLFFGMLLRSPRLLLRKFANG